MRRRVLFMFFVCLAAMGCKSQRPAMPERVVDVPDADQEYEAVTASALVFDPPIIADEPPLELSRAEREPGVAVGYEALTVEHFYIRFDDRQIGGGGSSRGRFGRGAGNRDRYERRAVTERIGVRYR